MKQTPLNLAQTAGALLPRRLLVAAFGAVLSTLAVGCVVNDDTGLDGGAGGGGGTQEVPDDSCLAGCEVLDGCGECLPDAAGNCLDIIQCADQCRAQGSQANFLCVTQVEACDGAGFGACLDGTAVDACQVACGQLEGCDRCVSDPSGNCLDSYGCLDECYNDRLPAAECLANLASCDLPAIEACFAEEDGAGDDACADACRAVDGCDQCILDEAGQCLSIAGCADQCRAGWADNASCVLAVADCNGDAIAECIATEAPADDCARGCNFLDACELCLVDDAGECLSQETCAEQCRAEDPTENACLNALESCEEEPIFACLSAEPEPPIGDDCDRACAALDGCELCWPDDEGNCLEVSACADSCRAGDPPPNIALCLAVINSCEAVDGCFNAPEIPDCGGACTALNACGVLPPGEPAEMLATCAAACEGTWTEAERACIAREAEQPACGSIATCVTASAPTTCVDICATYVACGTVPAEEAAACAARCEAGPGDEVACVVAAAADCVAAADCLVTPEPQAPDCAYVCNRELACERISGEVEGALGACIDACETADDRAQRICVGEAGEDCIAHAACFPELP